MSRPVETISACLETLEDTEFTKKSKILSLNFLILSLKEKNCNVSPQEFKRILSVFSGCMKNVHSINLALSGLLALLSNEKAIEKQPVHDMVPSALEVLNTLNNMTFLNDFENLRNLIMQVFLAYPKQVLDEILQNHSDHIIDIFKNSSICCNNQYLVINATPYFILRELLTKMTLEQLKPILEQTVTIWLTTYIDQVFQICMENPTLCLPYVELLEQVVDALCSTVCYFMHTSWNTFLSCVCDKNNYAIKIKTLLQNNSNVWHRLWIVVVKLLQTQITKNSPSGTPIHAILNIVELGFKVESHKVEAFQCWDTLIDVLSSDTTPRCVPRYIKLLLTPMKVNNAKTEKTIQAKLHTWWNLICKFHNKMDQFTVEVVISFLQFAFGKKQGNEGKNVVMHRACQYNDLISFCLQAFVQIVGHDDKCDCCKDVPKLGCKLLNNKLLASHWDDWMYALKVAIHLTQNMSCDWQHLETEKLHVVCIWRGFVMTIAELPPNGVKRDLFNELLKCLTQLLQDNGNSNIFYILLLLIMVFTERNEKIYEMLLMARSKDGALSKIVTILSNPEVVSLCLKYEHSRLIDMLRPITDAIVETGNIIWYLVELPKVYYSIPLVFWVSLMHSVENTKSTLTEASLSEILLWPLKDGEKTNSFNGDTVAATDLWLNLHRAHENTLRQHSFHQSISKLLFPKDNDNKSESNTKKMSYFKFAVSIEMLKCWFVREEDIFENTKRMEQLMGSISEYKPYEKAFPMLASTIAVMVTKIFSTKTIDDNIASTTMTCIMHFLKLVIPELRFENVKRNEITLMLNDIFEALIAACEVIDADIFTQFILDLTEFVVSFNKNINEIILYKFKQLEQSKNIVSPKILSQIRDSVQKLTKNIEKETEMVIKTCNTKEFVSPKVKPVKISKKKEAEIVKTLVENGTEYVVVKSHWKFNPRKLTEHQKEKLMRKREDIPALYQDLSQSQDEFKLTTWKADSQDATTTSTSNSTSESNNINLSKNENTTSILKAIDNSGIVPNIMKNIITDNSKTSNADATNTSVESPKKNGKSNKVVPITPKTTKSPRMALKDRVFRNVRNLIEKSSPINQNSNVINIEKPTPNNISNNEITVKSKEDFPKTPPPTENRNAENLVQSAPTLIPADRPSRQKKTPKKFDDVKLFSLKKRRRSHIDSVTSSNNNLEASGCMIARGKSKKVEELKNTKLNDNENDSVKTKTVDANLNSPDKPEGENDPTIERAPEHVLQEVISIDTPIETPVLENPTDCQNKNFDSPTHFKGHDNPEKIIDKPLIPEIKNNTQQEIKNDRKKNTKKSTVLAEPLKDKTETSPDRNNFETISKHEINTPKTTIQKSSNTEKPSSTSKKSSVRKSRLEKELAIDMVEGHPFLKSQSDQTSRVTRKKLMEIGNTSKRKSVTEDISKTKPEISPKVNNKKLKEKDKETTNNTQASITVEETQDNIPSNDTSCTEDIIESSQDSTLTTISVKSTKRTSKRVPVVVIAKVQNVCKDNLNMTQELLQDCQTLTEPSKNDVCSASVVDSIDDIQLPQNKIAEISENMSEHTENMDTESFTNESQKVIAIIHEEPTSLKSENQIIGQLTQELAEADTQPNSPDHFDEFEDNQLKEIPKIPNTAEDATQSLTPNKFSSQNYSGHKMEKDKSLADSSKLDDACSPFKDDAQRQRDFLNHTSEISPIKVQSPDKPNSPEEETSGEYLVVKLSSPVHSNGEPYRSASPEFFADDKILQKDQSPPRVEINTSCSSPSSLSLKKNRPQSKPGGGRAAQMLGLLCIPDSLKHSEKSELAEIKKTMTSTPAKRNLRALYNVVNDEDSPETQAEEHTKFLKLRKPLPSIDSSPSVPILKRKLDVIDDNTASPAGKRKRVSFHDPPVSTTVSVQKYIEPPLPRSPSSSLKRHATRGLTTSPKRLDNTLKLDTVLSKTLESFKDSDSLSHETNTSLDITPLVEVVNTSELNDKDPICPSLLNCDDPIENIALELSSSAMKDLLIKELEGKVATVGDLAKMTELEVNRLCIKAPKVQVAKRVLETYANKNFVDVNQLNDSPVRFPLVVVERVNISKYKMNVDQDLQQDSKCEILTKTNEGDTLSTTMDEFNKDIELPQNKIAEATKNNLESTINCNVSQDVIVINDEESPIPVDSESQSVGQETEELAKADTQPNDLADFDLHENSYSTDIPLIPSIADNITQSLTPCKVSSQNSTTENDECPLAASNKDDACSPYKDDAQRQREFLNNTLEISPIKVQSPDKQISPEKETSGEYLVVKLSSPVHSNGEPYRSGSPEFFADDKILQKDQSPPRVEINTSCSSPSSLSLKKNRPQSKPGGGRAAQMLGLLCIPDSLKHSEKSEPVEIKKATTSTPAKRNLRALYNAVTDDSSPDTVEEEPTNFLLLQKPLPSIDSSPSVPILKRKIDIVDENSVSPAGKRKRVSFHDPLVSTTVSVQKYIEPIVPRSPSSSQKRHITRSLTKSPKRLDSALKLDTVLSKALESFKDAESLSQETNTSSDTPVVEIANTSELNDKDILCPNQKDYANEKTANIQCLEVTEIANEVGEVAELEILTSNIETQTDTVSKCDVSTEIRPECVKLASTQTIDVPNKDTGVQTSESGATSTAQIISTCLAERPDFIMRLSETLPADKIVEVLSSQPDFNTILNQILDHRGKNMTDEERKTTEVEFFKNILIQRFSCRDLYLFFSRIFQSMYDKPT